MSSHTLLISPYTATKRSRGHPLKKPNERISRVENLSEDGREAFGPCGGVCTRRANRQSLLNLLDTRKFVLTFRLARL